MFRTDIPRQLGQPAAQEQIDIRLIIDRCLWCDRRCRCTSWDHGYSFIDYLIDYSTINSKSNDETGPNRCHRAYPFTARPIAKYLLRIESFHALRKRKEIDIAMLLFTNIGTYEIRLLTLSAEDAIIKSSSQSPSLYGKSDQYWGRRIVNLWFNEESIDPKYNLNHLMLC